ncbi:hypothetical protein FAIPA1_200089 [Frankia sp. AiPs1]|uniref:class I SAM-dependent methyltransferase n=1 Tax=Frankia sp. AiPa1 TaxID=573492 RepID=UPI00202B78C5|nr:class I SAM-dependent methyltransferase [Frankia sp. AiPa1]MCL9761304.1 class I SAM-dependent methyltransferase [Frankia sp. AiPa1]
MGEQAGGAHDASCDHSAPAAQGEAGQLAGHDRGTAGWTRDETRAHYERLAGGYDQNWDYGSGFVDWMAREISGALALTAADRIADIGCGTGLYTRRVREIVRPETPILCVDPSAAMLAQLPADPGLLPLRASAEELAGSEMPEKATDVKFVTGGGCGIWAAGCNPYKGGPSSRLRRRSPSHHRRARGAS